MENSIKIRYAGNLSGGTLIIYDRQGGEVKRLEPFNGEAIWNGKNNQGQMVANGAYLAVLKKGNKTQKKKIVIIK